MQGFAEGCRIRILKLFSLPQIAVCVAPYYAPGGVREDESV